MDFICNTIAILLNSVKSKKGNRLKGWVLPRRRRRAPGHLRNVLLDRAFFKKINTRPLLAADYAAELGDDDSGREALGICPARCHTPFARPSRILHTTCRE